MYKLIPCLCLAAACGGSSSSSSLSGVGSFTPNSSNALQPLTSEGTLETNFVQVILGSSTPPFNCTFADAGIPASVVIQGVVQIDIAYPSTLHTGTFSVTDPDTFFGTNIPTAGFAAVALLGPTSPPSNQSTETASSVSGTLTLTKAGSEWAGNFSATMALLDGGQGALSGSFDTSTTCAN